MSRPDPWPLGFIREFKDANPRVVSERLGHASIVLTLDVYSHVLPTMQEAASGKLEKMLFR